MIIGLTGGIGSGKSIVAKMFEILGCLVFNSDETAKLIYFEENIKSQVINLLGQEAYKNPTELNKSFISKKIFSNTDLLHQLNTIIHPEVKNCFETFKRENKNKIIIKESALLFEAKTDKDMDKIVLVTAKDEIRVNRVIERDGLTKDEVLKKIKAQISQEEKIKMADFVIYNNEEEFLITQVIKIFNNFS